MKRLPQVLSLLAFVGFFVALGVALSPILDPSRRNDALVKEINRNVAARNLAEKRETERLMREGKPRHGKPPAKLAAPVLR